MIKLSVIGDSVVEYKIIKGSHFESMSSFVLDNESWLESGIAAIYDIEHDDDFYQYLINIENYDLDKFFGKYHSDRKSNIKIFLRDLKINKILE